MLHFLLPVRPVRPNISVPTTVCFQILFVLFGFVYPYECRACFHNWNWLTRDDVGYWDGMDQGFKYSRKAAMGMHLSSNWISVLVVGRGIIGVVDSQPLTYAQDEKVLLFINDSDGCASSNGESPLAKRKGRQENTSRGKNR